MNWKEPPERFKQPKLSGLGIPPPKKWEGVKMEVTQAIDFAGGDCEPL